MTVRTIATGIVCATLLALLAQPASAAIIITITQQGSDVIATATGSVDTADLEPIGPGSGQYNQMQPYNSTI
jgi:hypothetical protein